jgi:hypothetical protein
MKKYFAAGVPMLVPQRMRALHDGSLQASVPQTSSIATRPRITAVSQRVAPPSGWRRQLKNVFKWPRMQPATQEVFKGSRTC